VRNAPLSCAILKLSAEEQFELLAEPLAPMVSGDMKN
jgi:hypothetical protein